MIRSILALLVLVPALAHADDWPQWRGPTRDGVWRETGIVERFAADRLARRWSVDVGSGYSGPTVADGRVYVTDRLVEPAQAERIHCFAWKTGKLLWSRQYECPYVDVGYQAGPRASVTIDEGRAYALGTMGHLHCLDAKTGEVRWKRDLNQDYQIRMPIWGIAVAPMIHDDLVILLIGGSDGASVVALDKVTGGHRWKALDDRAQYAAPIIVHQGGHPVVVCWTGDNVVGLDPGTGKLYWRVPFPQPTPIGIATPVVDSGRLFVTSFYDGSLMLRLSQNEPAAEELWRRRGRSEKDTDALHSIISTPIFRDDSIYGVDSYGELRCLDAKTGDRIWEDLTATPPARWSNIHSVTNGDKVWMFNERGELIIARLSREGFHQISRTALIKPTAQQLNQRDGVCWAHPAYAYRHIFVRNDNELVCASLEAE